MRSLDLLCSMSVAFSMSFSHLSCSAMLQPQLIHVCSHQSDHTAQWYSEPENYSCTMSVTRRIFLRGTVDTIWICLYSFQWPEKWRIPFSLFGIPSTIDLPLFNPSYFISYIYLLILIEFYCLTLVPWKFKEMSWSIARETGSKNLPLSKGCHHVPHSINCPVHKIQKTFHLMSMLIKR